MSGEFHHTDLKPHLAALRNAVHRITPSTQRGPLAMDDIDWSKFSKGDEVTITFKDAPPLTATLSEDGSLESDRLWVHNPWGGGFFSVPKTDAILTIEKVQPPLEPGDWGVDPETGRPVWVNEDSILIAVQPDGLIVRWPLDQPLPRDRIVWRTRGGKPVTPCKGCAEKLATS